MPARGFGRQPVTFMNLKTSCGGRVLPAIAPFFLLLGLGCSHEESHATATGGAGAAPVTSKAPIKYTAIPDKNATELIEKYRLVSDYLSKELGVPFEYVPTIDYNASIELFKSGDAMLAWFGGLTGVQAVAAVPGARMIAQGKVDPAFQSYFVVNESVNVQKSDSFPMGLKGLKFTFGSRQSTSGRLMPEYYIREHTKMAPEEFFGMPNAYSGAHDTTAKLVEAGTFQAGALNFQSYDGMVAKGTLDPNKCRIVWTTPTYPDYNWTAHPGLETKYGTGFTDRLQKAFIAAKDPALLDALQRKDGIIAAKNEDFEPIRKLAVQLGFL